MKQMEVDDENPTKDHVRKPRQIVGVRLNKAPKTAAERGREFRVRKALVKQQSKQQQEPDAIVETATEDIRSEIRTKEKKAKSAEATRRWRKKKKGVSESLKAQAKTTAQRMREYRKRKKLYRHSYYPSPSRNPPDSMNLDTVELINEIMIRPEIWMTKHPGNKNKWKTLSKWEEMKNSKFSLYTVDDLKKRWKNIKDQYRKELKKLPQSRPGVPLENITSNWKYFEYMTFMKDELVIYKEAMEREEGGRHEEGGRQEEHDIVGEGSTDACQDYKIIEVPEIKPEHLESPHHSDQKSDDEDLTATNITTPMNKPRNSQPPKEMREELLKIEQRKLQILEAEIAQSAAFMKSDNYQFLMSILPEMEKLPSVYKMRLRMKISQAVLDEVTSYEQQKFSNIQLIQGSGLETISVEIKEEPINMYD